MKRALLFAVIGLALVLLSGGATTSGPVLTNEQKALAYVAAQSGHPIDTLLLVYSTPLTLEYLGETVWTGKVYDSVNNGWYQVTFDSQGLLSDYATLRTQDREAKANTYGKLEPRLWELLQTVSGQEFITVAFWLRAIDRGAIDRQLEAQYPGLGVREARILSTTELSLEKVADLVGITLDPSDATFDPQIAWDELRERFDSAYVALLESALAGRQAPVMQRIQELGHNASGGGGLPVVWGSLPKPIILEVAQHPDVV